MELKEYTAKKDLNKIEELYVEAFPEIERKPFDLMAQKIGEGVQMLAVEDNGEFIGMAVMLIHEDIALLDYFAICPHMRGRNVGSRALEMIKRYYGESILLIEIEDTDEVCENQHMRVRRKSFYLRCGMVEMPYKVWFYGTKMQVLTSGAPVTFQKHHHVYRSVLGERVAEKIEEVRVF